MDTSKRDRSIYGTVASMGGGAYYCCLPAFIPASPHPSSAAAAHANCPEQCLGKLASGA
jgi:hypothetical protein